MGLFDVDGFGEKEVLDKLPDSGSDKVFVENSLPESIVGTINPLVKVEVINRRFSLGKLLRNLGLYLDGGNVYCPFHADEETGKPSAKYYESTDLLYCFSENKMYSAYHALGILYGRDTNAIFQELWAKMPEAERQEIMGKFDSNNPRASKKELSQWDMYREKVLDRFKEGGVTFRQYKNALYKVLLLIHSENHKGEI